MLEYSLKAEPSAMMALQRFNIHRLLPLPGWQFTGKKAAYRYLRDSVAGFPAPQAICEEMKTAGFKEIKFTRFVPGVAVVLSGLFFSLMLSYAGVILYCFVGRDFRIVKIFSRLGLHVERGL